MNVLEVLRRLDAYPKTLEEFRQKTISGAAVTLISSVLMIWLLISEFNAYMTPNISEELFVDTTRSNLLKINLELYIPMISCNCTLFSLFGFVWLFHLIPIDNFQISAWMRWTQPVTSIYT